MNAEKINGYTFQNLEDRYVNVSGDTMSGQLYINLGGSDKPSLRWNKGGSYWGGIGYNNEVNTNTFGSVDSNGAWVNTDTADIWKFRGSIISTSSITSSSGFIKNGLDNTYILQAGGGAKLESSLDVNSSKYLETWYSDGSKTYGTNYRLKAQWESNNTCKIIIPSYYTKVDYANYSTDSSTLGGTSKEDLFSSLSTNATNAISATIGGTTRNISVSDLSSSLNLSRFVEYFNTSISNGTGWYRIAETSGDRSRASWGTFNIFDKSTGSPCYREIHASVIIQRPGIVQLGGTQWSNSIQKARILYMSDWNSTTKAYLEIYTSAGNYDLHSYYSGYGWTVYDTATESTYDSSTDSHLVYELTLNNNAVFAADFYGTFHGSLDGNASTSTTATTAINLSSSPSLLISGNTIAVSAGNKTSSYITVPYATSSGSVLDKGNSTKIYFEYSGNGFSSNPSWLGAWDGYRLTYVSPSVLNVNYAISAGSVAWGNVSGKPSTYPPDVHTHKYLKHDAKGEDACIPEVYDAMQSFRCLSSTTGFSDGYILAWDWSSGSYITQLFADVDANYALLYRYRDSAGNWASWKRIPMGDGTGASGTWGINITGSAGSAGNADTLDGHDSSYFATSGHDHDGRYLKLSGGTMSGSISWNAGAAIPLVFSANDSTWISGLRYDWGSYTTVAFWGNHSYSQFVWNAGTNGSTTEINGYSTRTYDFQIGRNSSGTLQGLIGGNVILTSGNWSSYISVSGGGDDTIWESTQGTRYKLSVSSSAGSSSDTIYIVI